MMEKYAEFDHLSISIEGGLASVRFKAAEVEDFEHSFFTDVRDVFVPLGRDPEVRTVVLAVEPPRTSTSAFSRLISEATLEQRAGRFLTIQQIFTELATFRKPIVSAVIGTLSGINANLALYCDAVIASHGAKFGDGHVGIGIAAGDGGTALWPALVGPGLAKQILLEGRLLTAAEAHALGLVSQVVAEDEVLPTAVALAHRLGAQPRVAYLSTKLAINNHLRLAALLASDLTAAYEAVTVTEPEFAAARQLMQPATAPGPASP
jgi:enoyl-CoA hydratase